MTEGRALLLAAMARYAGPGYRMTSLEVQKIAYFLTEQYITELRFSKKISSVHMLESTSCIASDGRTLYSRLW